MTDTWKDTLLKTELAGIRIDPESVIFGTGRMFQRTRFPYRDGQSIEDLGRKTYTWKLSIPLFASVNASHYPGLFDQFMKVVEDTEKRGEVEFIDPERGPFDVKIVDYNWTIDAARRNGGVLTIDLEERGFEQSFTANLRKGKLAMRAAAAHAAKKAQYAIDMLAFAINEPSVSTKFSLTEAWGKFQSALDAGAMAADEVASRIDEVVGVGSRILAFDPVSELERWSITNSVFDAVGFAIEASEEASSDSATGGFVDVVINTPMSMWDIAQAHLDDAGRADEVSADNPTPNPFEYPAGSRIRLRR